MELDNEEHFHVKVIGFMYHMSNVFSGRNVIFLRKDQKEAAKA